MQGWVLALLTGTVVACSTAPPTPAPPPGATVVSEPAGPTACAPPRPEVCTMVYEPVCATLAEGLDRDTYSSPCNACADERVVAYEEGACE